MFRPEYHVYIAFWREIFTKLSKYEYWFGQEDWVVALESAESERTSLPVGSPPHRRLTLVLTDVVRRSRTVDGK